MFKYIHFGSYVKGDHCQFILPQLAVCLLRPLIEINILKFLLLYSAFVWVLKVVYPSQNYFQFLHPLQLFPYLNLFCKPLALIVSFWPKVPLFFNLEVLIRLFKSILLLFQHLVSSQNTQSRKFGVEEGEVVKLVQILTIALQFLVP